MKRRALLIVVSSTDRTLLGTADARRNDEVEAELARLHLLLVVIIQATSGWERVVLTG